MDFSFFEKHTFLRKFGIGKSLDYFVENLSMMLEAGMPINEALVSLAEDDRMKKIGWFLQEIREEIDGGSPLWKVFKKTKLFPDYTIFLIKVGEESGKLSENLKIIGEEQEKDRVFRSKIISAMMYPVFVLGLTVVVGLGIASFILPKLSLVFSQLKIQLPLVTRLLINFGVFLNNNGLWAILLIFLIFGGLIYYLFFNKSSRHFGRGLLFNLPILGNLIQQVELSRLGYFLGSLLEAGLPISEALRSVKSTSFSPQFFNLYDFLEKKILDGESFKKSLASFPDSKKIVPSSLQQLIGAAERSGFLSRVFLKIGKMNEEKIETTMKNLSTILEPILLVLVWLGVVFVALAVILPIYSLIGNLNN